MTDLTTHRTTERTTGRTGGRPRRRLLAVGTVLLTVLGCSGVDDREGSPGAASDSSSAPHGCGPAERDPGPRLERLERDADAVIGVYAVDTGTGEERAHRADERFAFASTVKALAAAVVLDRLSARDLARRIRWDEADLVPYSPVTEQHVDDGLTVRELLEAAVTVSDNTAANLLLDLVGGPAALDRALEAVGDAATEVVRREPDLNDYTPGDARDTTTPRAIASSLAAFTVGGGLAPADERLLNGLLRRNTTGDALIRAAVPPGWEVGDKTGTASYGTRNDVAVLSPPGGEPIVLAVLTRRRTADAVGDDALVAEAARAVLDSLCRSTRGG